LEQEAAALEADPGEQDRLVVLARYMQVLSDGLSAKLRGPLHQHPPLVPAGLQGRQALPPGPYAGREADRRLAHYVTGDLDEGPIIEQDVERISHRDTPDDLIRKGRDIERRVLARAVRYRLEDRVLLNGRKTVVFTD
jgi:formyltetrahydrofolate deformylase